MQIVELFAAWWAARRQSRHLRWLKAQKVFYLARPAPRCIVRTDSEIKQYLGVR